MIFPRGRRARHRYQKHKVVAALITFAVGWAALQALPDLRERLALPFAKPGPAEAYERRDSGIQVQVLAVVERALPDSVPPSGTERALPRLKMRSADGHPFTLLGAIDGGHPAPGDTLRVAGRYVWDPAGGTVLVGEPPGARPF